MPLLKVDDALGVIGQCLTLQKSLKPICAPQRLQGSPPHNGVAALEADEIENWDPFGGEEIAALLSSFPAGGEQESNVEMPNPEECQGTALIRIVVAWKKLAELDKPGGKGDYQILKTYSYVEMMIKIDGSTHAEVNAGPFR
ncbi:hypothetical protein LTR17_005155 [Elasticomyces elasticus]|nr:hypothetical protein LTR17_005155 [Elasticomyces elasticus]